MDDRLPKTNSINRRKYEELDCGVQASISPSSLNQISILSPLKMWNYV